ncbi:unnamed protein product [Cylicocyclus nassatus]|uniref:Uncharacterized protein n=1 Tax=Cylicocyclus nassatus TaxID=53992 RepID=A0AA36GVA4_CYLNA|nr:unnamed protein product [Cylicocyclus nassatus]
MQKPPSGAATSKSKQPFEGFQAMEPLREGDDVNLNSEAEDLKGKDSLDQTKTGAETKTAGATGKPAAGAARQSKIVPIGKAGKEVNQTKSKSERSTKKTLIMCAVAIILVILLLTSAASLIVTLHWYGTIDWFPPLTKALQGD